MMDPGRDLVVRVARPADAAAVGALLRAAYSALLAGAYDAALLERALPWMAEPNPKLLRRGTWYVAERAESPWRLVGCGGWTLARPGDGTGEPDPTVRHLRHFATHSDCARSASSCWDRPPPCWAGASPFAERGWRLRLHGPGAPPSAVAAARRAVRAALVDPGERAVGFALLRPSGDGGWALLAHVWRGAELVREASLLLSEDGGPPRRCPALARSLGTAEDVLLLGREAEAWGRCGGDADAYLAATDR